MKPGRILIILVIVLLGVVIYVNKCSSGKSTGNAAGSGSKPGGPLMVSGYIVKPQSVSDEIYASGTLMANNEVEIRNEIPGRMLKLGFEEGGSVKKGDLLVKIDDDELQAQLRKLLVDKALAEKSESRTKDLLDIKGISQQEYDVALNSLNKVQADVDLLKAQISKTEIRAPFSGIIGLRTVSEGAYLPANTRIATLQQVDPMKLEFSIPEKYLSEMGRNKDVQFTVESASGNFSGKVYAYEPKIDLATRSITLRASCNNPKNELLPGAFAKINVPLEKINDALMIPSQCIIPELKGHKVFIARNGTASPVKVELGLRNDTTVQVINGLHAGDTVLTTGIMQMRPDMPVKVSLQ